MTDESITQKRGRGRPRKDEKIPAASVDAVPANDILDESRMQEQIKENLKQLLKLAAKQGVSLEDLFDTPPAEINKVEEPVPVHAEIDSELGIVADTQPRNADGRRPGDYIRNEAGEVIHWIEWNRNNLVNTKRVRFIPRPIPTMVYPLHDPYGLQKIKLDVNGLACWLTCGVENEVYEFFYNAYLDGERAYTELEHFKAHGPDAAPWGSLGPDGRPAWRFTPQALTFGMDADGKYLIDSPLYERSADDTGE